MIQYQHASYAALFAAVLWIPGPLFADPPQSAAWVPIPELTDEFNGAALDATKWFDHNPGWKGRQPGFFSKNNVSVHDGMLHLTAKAEDLPGLPEGYHTFTTAAVQSQARVKYGYFEIRCKPMKSRASSSFWFYDITPEMWTEIDVFEMGAAAPGHENKYHMNVHVFHTPTYKGTDENHLSDSQTWETPFPLAGDFHVYALEWDEENIKWHVDGQVVRTVKNQYWHQPLTLNFDSETMPDWFGLPDAATLPATYSIDYVRSWKKAGAPKTSNASQP